MNNTEKAEQSAKKNFAEFFRNPWNIVGVVLCVILIPILLLNCILIVKGMVKPDEVPSIGGYSPLIVLTESMEPEIKSGDLIVCRKTDISDIREGMVISFFDPEGNGSTVVTHKINTIQTDEKGNVYYRTQGVNNNIEDRVPVPSENVIGVYTGVRFAFIGRVVMFAQSPVGLLVCIAVPVGIFALFIFFKNRRSKKETVTASQDSMAEIAALRAEIAALKEVRDEKSEKTAEVSENVVENNTENNVESTAENTEENCEENNAENVSVGGEETGVNPLSEQEPHDDKPKTE